MTDKEIIAVIAAYDKREFEQEASSYYNITNRLSLEDGLEVVVFEFNDGHESEIFTTSALVADNEVYVLKDWSDCPTTDEEVANYLWINTETGNFLTTSEKLPPTLEKIDSKMSKEEVLALWKSGKLLMTI